ncbi:MAG: hypothetical protein ACTHK6_11140 [Solirubrobacterales bacterium]
MAVARTGKDMQGLLCGFAASLTLLIAALAFAPPADAHARGHIYWTTNGGDIGRANLNGTGVNRHFISGAGIYPRAIAVSGRHVYWAETIRSAIGRANLDGTGVDPEFLSFPGSPLFQPHDIAVRAGYLYWTNWNMFIGRAKLDGTHARLDFIPVRYYGPGYLAANARHLYWTGMAFEEPNVIGRANLDGTGVKDNLFQSETDPFHLAVGDGHLFWTTPTDAIVRADLDGTGVRPKFIISGKRQPGGIAVGGAHVYWTAFAYSSTNPAEATALGWIGRANLDGKGVRWMVASSGEEVPTDVAVSPGRPRR